MHIASAAALAFAALATGVIAFQLALALGAPWGAYAMGGLYPGRFPARLRVAAVVQAVVIGVLALAILSRAGLLVADVVASLPWLPWVTVAISAIAVVLNAASRSAGERRIWVPVAVAMLVTSLVVVIAA